MNLIEFFRTTCRIATEQKGETLHSKEVLRDLATDAGYYEPDIEDVLADLPALVNEKHFKV